MTVPTTPAAPTQGAPDEQAPPARQSTAGAITAARQRLADGGSIVEPAAEVAESVAASAEAGLEDLTITLEGLPERGEQDVELEAPDAETFRVLNRLQQEAVVGRQVKQERRGIEDLQRELTEVEDMIAADPAGFVLGEHVPEHVRTDVAMQLLFEPGTLEAIDQQLRERGLEGGLAEVLEDPESLRVHRAESRARRLEMRDTLRAQNEARKAMQATARRVAAEVDRLIPQHITGEERERLYADAVGDLQDRARRLGLTQLDPSDVRLIVAARLRQHGIDLHAGGAHSAPQRQAVPVRRPEPPVAPASELPRDTAGRIKAAREVGLRALLDRARAGE